VLSNIGFTSAAFFRNLQLCAGPRGRAAAALQIAQMAADTLLADDVACA
jgi:hypothetical protein